MKNHSRTQPGGSHDEVAPPHRTARSCCRTVRSVFYVRAGVSVQAGACRDRVSAGGVKRRGRSAGLPESLRDRGPAVRDR